ncbi:Cof-type HAD-IIB family hydrolase [Paenibacillus sp. D2_2]|uniref:Cof-type HAD-IIB family hydrolase n=1 Tax=Paenibacillus sp. D2_2 TaxID=3073092 RepID=UPI002815C4BA|nr:Cof-type HAD-IIB family hydrolase [Paenibacillus sp. D2_2]WMT43190.1 Cof-type HAD-IIB family hydrolase [Paenibacillus sp. D2_2]
MTKIRLVFSDIDGTLINSNHVISEQTKHAVKTTTNLGVPFVLVSARMPRGILPLQKELEIDSPIICYGGSLVIDGEGNTVLSKSLPQKNINGIYEMVKSKFANIQINIYSHDQWIVENSQDEWVIQEQQITRVTPVQSDLISFINSKPEVHKILCMGPSEDIEELRKVVMTDNSDLTIYKSKDTYLEIMSGEASKSKVIQQLMNHYDVKREEIMAIGDNFNDVDMLKFAGLGIAMGNAPDEVKIYANQVTSSNDEEGVSLSLEKNVIRQTLVI